MQPLKHLVAIQALLSFSDNALKNVFGFFITFQGASLLNLPTNVSLMMGALALASPYFLFSGVAGVLTARLPSATVIRWSRLFEIPISVVSGLAIIYENMILLLICLFVYSTQSALFTTAKLSYVPELVSKNKLISANAILQSSTLAGILFGLIFGGLAIGNNEKLPVVAVLLFAALAGFLISRKLPDVTSSHNKKLSLAELNPLSATRRALRVVFQDFRSGTIAVSIAWFWIVGLILTSILPDVAQGKLAISANTTNLLIAAFVLGIALGGFVVSKLTAGRVTAAYSPWAAVGMAVFCVELSWAVQSYTIHPPDQITTFWSFLGGFSGLRILFDLMAISAFGAAYLVPVYALLQSIPARCGRAILVSGSVTVDALSSTIAAALLVGLFAMGLTFEGLLYGLAGINILIALLLTKSMSSLTIADDEIDHPANRGTFS
jgi:acyl-[acyl-carrier-protein]-phospholipid O-acyltransferase/long-chain-fatty-acid--[acyl-carrier-protein] ligase